MDMWEPFRRSIEQWVPGCKVIYDKFHVLGHANDAVDAVRKTEFFRQGREKRELIKGKKWLLLSRRRNLNGERRGDLNERELSATLRSGSEPDGWMVRP